jgi:hypothetical protein
VQRLVGQDQDQTANRQGDSVAGCYAGHYRPRAVPKSDDGCCGNDDPRTEASRCAEQDRHAGSHQRVRQHHSRQQRRDPHTPLIEDPLSPGCSGNGQHHQHGLVRDQGASSSPTPATNARMIWRVQATLLTAAMMKTIPPYIDLAVFGPTSHQASPLVRPPTRQCRSHGR